jgi:elongation factor Ts
MKEYDPMMTVTMEAIKELRTITGAGMMDVRQALAESEGDKEKAIELLRQKGAATAEKKATRTAAEGKIAAYVENGVGALVEVNCETDFSANNELFLGLVEAARQAVGAQNHTDVESVMAASVNGRPLKETFTEVIGAVRENMKVARFVRYEQSENGYVHAYIHGAGKIGVLIETACANMAQCHAKAEFETFTKDMAMQIAAFAPEFISRDDVPADEVANETRIEMGKEDLQNKPEEIRAKIVAGRVEKNLATRVLLSQAYVKDPSKTIAELMVELGKKTGGEVSILRFTRYGLGETAEHNPDQDD